MVLSVKYNKIPDISTYIGNVNNKFDGKTAETLAKIIGYDTKKLWMDYQMVNRLLYRSQNQHKASLAFRHLKEVKRAGERIGKLEVWLKGNLNDSDSEKLFDFTGYLNTLRLLIEMAIEACGKTFYFYMQYLDQALFVQLSLVAVGCVGSICKEFKQWLKYIQLLYRSCLDKLRVLKGEEVVEKWRVENHLTEVKTVVAVETESTAVKITPPVVTKTTHKLPNIPINNTTSAVKISKPSTAFVSKHKKKHKSQAGGAGADEIDDIFNNF